MTAVRVAPDRLRALAREARADLDEVARRLAAVRRLADAVRPGDGVPARTDLLDDAATAVAALLQLVGVLDLVADEAERLDERFRDRRLAAMAMRLAAAAPPPTDDLAQVLAALDGPVAVRSLWRTLTPAQVTGLVQSRPGLVGGLDGVDLATRDRANRRRLAAARAPLVRRIAQLEARTADVRRLDDAVGHAGSELDRAHVAALQQRLGRLDAIAAADVVVLWDPQGDGRAVVARGDPATASTVATLVPGMANSLATFPRVAAQAEALHDELVAQAAATGRTDRDVATVAWLGYDAPSGAGWGLLEAATDHVAASERGRLVQWGAGLDAVNPDVHHVVVAHSYGSVLAGQALRDVPGGDRLRLDRLVVLGSPGLGSGVGGVTDLGLAPGRVHAAAAGHDPVPGVPLLGPDPTRWPGVVRVPLGPANRGHGDYLAPGSRGLAQVARTVLGLPPLRAREW
jgi:hypothetical protein